MRVWLVTCLILFTLVQFYEWARGFIVPLPIYVLAGAFLAIASNYDRGNREQGTGNRIEGDVNLARDDLERAVTTEE